MGGGGCVLLSTGGTSAPVLWLSAASSHDSIKVGRGKGLNLWGSKYRVKPICECDPWHLHWVLGGWAGSGRACGCVPRWVLLYGTGESMLQTSP